MTVPAPHTPDEPARLQALRAFNVVDTPIDERFERVTRLAQRFFRVKIAAVSLIESDRQWFKSVQGLDVCETSREVSFCSHGLHHDSIMVVEDARLDPRFKDNPLVTGELGIVFYAGAVIRSPCGAALGMVCIKDDKPRTLSEDDAETLRDLAAIAYTKLMATRASALQADLLEQFTAEQRRSMIDDLTRVWNRAGILDVAEQATARSREHGWALVSVDLDHFKQINDEHGHGAGDDVLRETGRRLTASVRETDSVGRLGGDEFLLVLPRCESEAKARDVAERARERIAGKPIRTKRGEVRVSASFGVRFVAPGDSIDLDAALIDSDGALYESKRDGRDRVAAA